MGKKEMHLLLLACSGSLPHPFQYTWKRSSNKGGVLTVQKDTTIKYTNSEVQWSTPKNNLETHRREREGRSEVELMGRGASVCSRQEEVEELCKEALIMCHPACRRQVAGNHNTNLTPWHHKPHPLHSTCWRQRRSPQHTWNKATQCQHYQD